MNACLSCFPDRARRSGLARVAAFVFALAGGCAVAGPVADVSRTGVVFGRTPQNIASPSQPVWIANAGDANLEITALAIGGTHASDFSASGDCLAPATLAPGERCRVEIVMLAANKTPANRFATLSVTTNATPAAIAVALSGIVDNGIPSNPLTALPVSPTPDWIDFGAQPVGTAAATRSLVLANSGNLLLQLASIALVGGETNDFAFSNSCATGAFVSPGQSCTVTIGFTPLAAGLRATELDVNLTFMGIEGTTRYSLSGVGSTATPLLIDVIEYFNAGFGHYFMTALPGEIALLDGGAFGGAFVRTGHSFRAWSSPANGTSPVCRFFTVTFAPKSSHFYTGYASECELTKANPDWLYEAIAFHAMLPTANACPVGSAPVYRMYNNGHTAAPNHRFTTDLALYQQFTATPNWTGEGIVFCEPGPAP